MDVTLLAQQIVAAGLPLLAKGGEEFAKKSGEAVFQGAKELWKRITESFGTHPAAAEALAQLEAEPQSTEQQAVARTAVAEALAADATLEASVAPLIKDLTKVCAAYTPMTVNVSGGGKVGSVTQVGNVGGDFIIGKR